MDLSLSAAAREYVMAKGGSIHLAVPRGMSLC